MDNSAVAYFILKILLAILLITTYLYIEKLEQTGCECSEHPNRQFIKTFSLFSAIFYLITVFVNPANLDLGNAFMGIYYTSSSKQINYNHPFCSIFIHLITWIYI